MSTIKATIRIEIRRTDGSLTIIEESALGQSGNHLFERAVAKKAIEAMATEVLARIADHGEPLNGVGPVSCGAAARDAAGEGDELVRRAHRPWS